VRYPVLWERTAPDGVCDFTWPDARMARLRELGVPAIVGLMHHGSGPRSTSLLDPLLPEKLADYAGRVAERYPWVDAWTPINEPLTTARFSALYGYWYPHAADSHSFALALVHQCQAIASAMRAIRKVNPRARLVQTEDLAFVRATPRLQYQADFENHRRWLTFDLLYGLVDHHHPMYRYLAGQGDDVRRVLDGLCEAPCPPALLGLNYYATSERFLDDRIDHYPPSAIGGNGRDLYADVEAVRVCPDGLLGLRALLGQAWARYHQPMAVTEAHLGCHVDDQCRWLVSVWGDACAARHDGADVRAVTAWAAFGSYDWHNLVTREDGRYEPGLFDVRGGTPRPTLLAEVARALARGARPGHLGIQGQGWWESDQRLVYRPEARPMDGRAA
jgi:dTDP-4-dehydrorhamnose reductase